MAGAIRGRGRLFVLAGILAAGLGFRLWGLGWGLYNATISARPHPDEWTVYWLFRWFDQGHNLNPCPAYPGRCFFDWGTAFPYLAYAFHFLSGPFVALTPPSTFGPSAGLTFIHIALEGRLLSVLVSTVTIAVAYKLATSAFGHGAGLLAAAMVALSGLLIQLAHFATPDSTTILLLSLTLLAAYRASVEPGTARFLLAGSLWGAAMGSEYHMLLLAAPVAAAWFLAGQRRPLWLLAAGGAAILVCLLLNVYALVNLSAFIDAAEHTLRIRTIDSGLEYQDRWAPYGPAWLYVIRYPLGYGVGFALAGWMLLGVAWSAFRRTRADVILLAWIVPYFLLVTLEPAKFMRYSAPLLVPLAVLAARFAVDLAARPAVIRPILAAAAIAALAYSAVYDAAYAGLFASPDPRAVATNLIRSHTHRWAPVGYEELPDGVIDLPYFLAGSVQPCFTQFRLSRLAGLEYVILDSYTVEGQPAAMKRQIARFERSLAHNRNFVLARRIHYVPTFLGLRFPIDASPHDWRYPTHIITVYRRVRGPVSPGRYCYSDLSAAHNALYVAPTSGTVAGKG